MADVKLEKRPDQRREQGLERWHSDWWTSNPFSLMRRLSEEMDRAFGSSFGLTRGFGEMGWTPAIEVREQDGNMVVCADLPGMNKEDVKVEVTGDGLVIEGERKQEHKETTGGVHRSERTYGHFYRMVPLPEGANIDKAQAQFKDGVLEVKVPVPEAKSKTRQIPINT